MMKKALVVLLILASAACGSSEPGANPDEPVSTDAGSGQPSEPVPSPIQPTPGLDNVRPLAWQDALVGDDDRTVTLLFYTGLPECYGLDRVEADEGADEITITLYGGTVPGAQACAEIAVYASTTVTLDGPVAGRTIVDGAP